MSEGFFDPSLIFRGFIMENVDDYYDFDQFILNERGRGGGSSGPAPGWWRS